MANRRQQANESRTPTEIWAAGTRVVIMYVGDKLTKNGKKLVNMRQVDEQTGELKEDGLFVSYFMQPQLAANLIKGMTFHTKSDFLIYDGEMPDGTPTHDAYPRIEIEAPKGF